MTRDVASHAKTGATTGLTVLLLLPPIVAALWVGALEIWRWQQPRAPLFAAPFVYSLADAIGGDDVPAAHRFIRAGQDAKALIAVRHDHLTGGRDVLVPPIVWAVAAGSHRSVLMLVGYGARIDAATAQQLTCVARQFGSADMQRVLGRVAAGASPEACVPLPTDRPLLPLPAR